MSEQAGQTLEEGKHTVGAWCRVKGMIQNIKTKKVFRNNFQGKAEVAFINNSKLVDLLITTSSLRWILS